MENAKPGLTAGSLPSDPIPDLPALASQVFAWSDRAIIPTPSGECRAFFDARTVTLARLESHVSTVNVGHASHPPHQHSDEELVIIREGTLEVMINGKTQLAGPGSVVFYSCLDLHGMRNAGDTPAIYHVIRWAPLAPSER